MSAQKTPKPSLKPRFGGTPRRRVVTADGGALVEMKDFGGGPLPLLVTPAVDGVELSEWAAANRPLIEERLRQHGGLLFRGFGLATPAELEGLVKAVSGNPLEYTYRSTPRHRVEGEVYTSTEYPADQTIPLHNEMSYSREWPRKIFFLCAVAAPRGGETPIADSARVYGGVPEPVRERFLEHGVMYVRNYGGGLDLPWQEVFQTSEREVVESFCADRGIEVEWLPEDRLRTRQVCQAVVQHPEDDVPLWFNQAHLFHVSSLAPEVRRSLLAEIPEEELPRNAFYGDGSSIPEGDLAAVRGAYEGATVEFPWQDGDVLLLDNMRVAHGRRPFSGPRKVLVGMAEACAVPTEVQ